MYIFSTSQLARRWMPGIRQPSK